MRRKAGWILVALLAGARADAMPAFARKTGMGCPACHESWPKLNDFGELFRDRGYRVSADDESPFVRLLDYFPVSLRTTVGYQYSVTSHQPADDGEHTIKTGGFNFPTADLLVGTALSRHFSIGAVIAGFSEDGLATLESAWARANDLGTSWLNIKLGKLELDLPISQHRNMTFTTPILIYQHHPDGSANPFSMGENQLGLEIMGHGDRPGLRYSVAVVSSGQTASPLSNPVVYGHLTYTFLPSSRILTRLRLGIVGDGGWFATRFKTRTLPSAATEPVPGTGSAHEPFFHAGGEVQLMFGPLSMPLSLTAFWMYGHEEAAFTAGADADGQFHGGLVELDYTPLLALTLFGRYDGAYSIVQPDPALPQDSGDQTAFTLGARYALLSSSWGSVVAHVEVSTTDTQNAAPSGASVRSTIVFAGIDLAL